MLAATTTTTTPAIYNPSHQLGNALDTLYTGNLVATVKRGNCPVANACRG